MRTNLICMGADQFTNEQYSSALKASYLLSDQTLALGDIEFLINVRMYFKNATTDLKIIAMEVAAHNNEDEETKIQLEELVAGFKKAYKDFQKMKYKSTQIISLFKKLEHSFNKQYQHFANHMIQNAIDTGFDSISGIVEPNVFDVYSISKQDAEQYAKWCSNEILLSDALFLNLPGTPVGNEIILLSNNYFSKDFINDLRLVDAHEDGATTSKYGFLETICSFPSLTKLSDKELVNLRTAYLKKGNELRNSIDTWANFYKENTDLNQEERISYFKNVLKPTALDLQNKICENETIQYVAKSSKSKFNEYDVLMGETTIEHLWNYYQFLGIIPESTLEKINAKKEADPTYTKKRIPIMCVVSYKDVDIYLADQFQLEDKMKEDQKIISTKKSINLD